MKRELRRLDAADRDRALRRALASRRRTGSTNWDPVEAPCPWWSATDARAHRAWLDAPVPEAVAFEDLNPCVQWEAGQPVLLRTGGHQHFAYVRLRGFAFGPRWLAGSIQERRASPAELSTRDPRQVWADSYELQLAQALLSAEGDKRCIWLRDIDEQTEPELFDLLLLAREELAYRSDPAPTAGPAPTSPAPAPVRKAWTKAERDAMRAASAAPPEYVDLAPGR